MNPNGLLLHAVAGLGRAQGGPAYSVPSLCAGLARTGAQVSLYAVRSARDDVHDNVDAQLCQQDFHGIPFVGQLRASRDFRRRIREAAAQARVLHAHGLWLLPNVEAGVAARRAGVPLVVSPRGMLATEALQISSLRKRVFWKVLQEQAYAGAELWHATSDAEADDIRAFGVRAPIVVLPNGIDLPRPEDGVSESRDFTRTILYLGRIHPKKALTSLVRAWAAVAGEHPDWRLRIIGPDENRHSAELLALASQLSVRNFSIEPPLYGADKEKALADASIFVLPTLNENFGIAVAEALASGVPAIVTKGAPWRGLHDHSCGWWIDHGAEPLAQALREAIALPPERLRCMGAAGRAWMARDYAWDTIALGMLAAYEWLTKCGPRPGTVRLT